MTKFLPALVGLLAIATLQQRALAQEPPKAPVLRIDAGMHTRPITSIAIDAAGRFLVTASPDKTVRLWELPSGRMSHVFRAPIGADFEGSLYAVAISPDGNTIATGGWTGYEWERTNFVYLFDRQSGKLTRRLGGFPSTINGLSYSADGRYLAIALGARGGIRVVAAGTYAPVGEDTAYGDHSYGLDFDASNRLVTTSRDGFVRLYAPPSASGLQLLARQPVPGGLLPGQVRFSPDGARIAVSSFNAARVTVLRGSDLAPLYTPLTTGLNDGFLSSVAWSRDGATLYASGGVFDLTGRKVIRAWTDANGARYRDIVIPSSDSITSIRPLRDGGLVYGSADPNFAVLDAAGRVTAYGARPIADYRNGMLAVAPDASGVDFSFSFYGVAPGRFSVNGRQLDSAPATASNWAAPLRDDGSLRITDWANNNAPKLNGAPLALEPNEVSFALALAPDRSSFLLGSNFYLRLFDRSGRERWRAPALDVAWAANISANGRYAVAAYADGTIRWYRMTDGRELLALFPHADRQHWVMWTPSGYYDAAPGSEDLFGWQVNNRRDEAADFFPAGRFRSTYYRPDVIARVLDAGDELQALARANDQSGRNDRQISISEQLPPVIELVGPADNSSVSTPQVSVQYRVRNPTGEAVTSVKILVNGRPVGSGQSEPGGAASAAVRTASVPLPEGDSTISIIAENRYAASVPATIKVTRNAPVAARAEAALLVRPKLYILSVGVSQYANPQYNLKLADKDARDFVNAMLTQKDLLYRDVVVKLLTNAQATKDDILDGLDWIRRETTSNDVAMVFFAGHGINDQNNYYYYAPYNVDPERLLRTGISFNDIKSTLAAIAGKALFFVDTCHSGNSIGMAARRGSMDINVVINELASAENGVVVFSASTGSESSLELAAWNNGAFTKALVEGLSGKASIGGSQRITYNMLNLYLSERVKELTRGQQHPTMISPQTVPDFPVAVIRPPR